MSAPSGFEVFFDGECPLCRREIDMIRRLDTRRRVALVDISARGFEPPAPLTQADLMAKIHGRRADGTLVEGVEVFREIYTSVGFGAVVALTRLPPLSWALDAGYRWFAKNRLRITGRCTDASCDVSQRASKPRTEASPCAP